MALTLSDHAALANSLFSFLNIFDWKIIALQCCLGFCHTIRRKDTHVPLLLNLPPCFIPISPLWVVTEHPAELPGSDGSFALAGCCTHTMSMHLPSSPPPSSPTVAASPCSASASPFLPCKRVRQYSRSRFHMRVNM